ncbi:L-ascorbate metabolism protein UlaG, beta-lactamase superfamily [Sanguibacter gelidistatuariae]|uniref:L-ascorbate metabolism protein UlaG, beta-lactamase superfamily n=1 Tax=Sanguibacter gelidistatuariae TaxID=1814289 RepID=A0A1G6HAF5_9MICO|nr:MBL fold metallo-hydrolase [Sanguibacter gelidistatuariae]SDB90915.1 L-ascorbate metabolism protein UlaG, beta-lactamase superfamily [Sanguibacter gelidistatuariae]
MELTKHGHACVVLTKDGSRLVIDPGSFTAPDAMDAATAILITHEHLDHFQAETLLAALEADPALKVWTNSAVAETLGSHRGRVRAVGQDDAFEAGGFEVKVFGEWHEVVHPDLPRVRNVGFLVDDVVFHPGDAYTVPGQAIDTLLTPLYSPWSSVTGLVDWVREVGPCQTFSVHDAPLNDIGHAMMNRFLGPAGPGTGATHHQLALHEQIQLP